MTQRMGGSVKKLAWSMALAVGLSIVTAPTAIAGPRTGASVVQTSPVHAAATTPADRKAKKRGTLRVIAQGMPQGRSAKMVVAGKSFRKKVPPAGKLRNLRPGRYRVWASPIAVDGGTAAVPDLPVKVKVRKRTKLTLRLQYTWSPRNDTFPPGPASGLELTDRSLSSVSLRWTNGAAPDLRGVVVRRLEGDTPAVSVDEGQAVPVEPDATSVVDEGLSAHTAYSYSVFMVDMSGNASRPATITVRTVARAQEITAGTAHTCALVSDEADRTDVVCWGDNTHGQLGDGTTVDASLPRNVQVPGAVEVDAGGDHTCARTGSGSLLCWGRNDMGQVKGSGEQQVATPLRVDLDEALDVSAGNDHTCAALIDGSVWCWGANERGQLGVAGSSAVGPVQVPGVATAVSVTAGYAHTCAVLANATVRCWGANNHGQLGDGTREDSADPVRPTVTRIASVSAGVFHTCAVTTDGATSCWGANDYGQLGDGTRTDRTSPRPVELPDASAVSAGAYHTCAVTGSVVRCWGRNVAGRLGDGTEVDRLNPVRILTGSGVSVAAGGYHSCAVSATSVRCWGSNTHGQLATGTRVGSLRPIPTQL
jgi:alpha-tubulin suppressor-like RCC1 family protein